MMENILGFPETTIVDKLVPKNAFYKNWEVNGKMKQHFVDDVAQIKWAYKLAPFNLHVEDGKRVHEIAVFLVSMKAQECPLDVFTFIDKNMPRHVVFVLEHAGSYKLLLNYKEPADAEGSTFRILQSFTTDWMPSLSELSLTIEGNDMDTIYEHFAGIISGFGTSSHEATQRIIELEEMIDKKVRYAESLQKKIRTEKQFNRQMELNGEARRIKREIEKMKKELSGLKG